MKKCVKQCFESQTKCKNKECRMWLDYGEDLNCTLIAVDKNGPMTLREIAKRENISFVRVKQIQDEATKKMYRLIKNS
tara:strand:+ start:299 stop:532 length:234 start_codon:yes stop_codon:yes gene_type:complete